MDANDFFKSFQSLVMHNGVCSRWTTTKKSSLPRRALWRIKTMVLGGYKFRLHYNTYGYNSYSLRITGAWPADSDVACLRVYNGPRSSYCVGELCIDSNDAARWTKELDLNTWMKIRLSS